MADMISLISIVSLFLQDRVTVKPHVYFDFCCSSQFSASSRRYCASRLTDTAAKRRFELL